MPHALLLSPDDQAVSAITGVLEEMFVSCERPLDGVSAAQKLNSQSFDLVLVDCENLPAAKLIFDVCRRGKNGHNPVPIAIVDGRAGLPTAFRLGAELILTKPVAKDQARSTIRTAVSRVRKDGPAVANAPSSSASDLSIDISIDAQQAAASATLAGANHLLPDSPAVADATQVNVPQLTSFAEPAHGVFPAASSSATGAAASAATAATTRSVTAYMKEVKSKEQAEELPLQVTTPAESRAATPKIAVPAKSNSHARPSNAETSKTLVVMRPSDDPVLLELERSELEEGTKKFATDKAQAETFTASERNKVDREREHGSHLLPPPVQPKRNGMLAGTLMLALAGGGLYAVWNYQPDFRIMAQAQINHLLSSIGVEPASVVTPKPEKLQASPVANPATAKVKANNGANQAAATMAVEGAPKPAVSAAGSSSGDVASTADKIAVPRPVEKQDLEKQSSDTKLVESKFSPTPGSLKPQSASDETESTVSSNSDAVILSSQGAQKRLLFSVQPKYPLEQSSRGAQGTIVLKTNVLANGRVGSVQLVEGNPTLANAAMESVKQWRYRPYLRSGKAEPFQTVVIVDFHRP